MRALAHEWISETNVILILNAQNSFRNGWMCNAMQSKMNEGAGH